MAVLVVLVEMWEGRGRRVVMELSAWMAASLKMFRRQSEPA
jgi:hypothetical protein